MVTTVGTAGWKYNVFGSWNHGRLYHVIYIYPIILTLLEYHNFHHNFYHNFNQLGMRFCVSAVRLLRNKQLNRAFEVSSVPHFCSVGRNLAVFLSQVSFVLLG